MKKINEKKFNSIENLGNRFQFSYQDQALIPFI